MLSGYFENCYGIKQFTLPAISFNPCNKVIIYAPNGVMGVASLQSFSDCRQTYHQKKLKTALEYK